MPGRIGRKQTDPQYQLALLRGLAHSLYLDIGEAVELEKDPDASTKDKQEALSNLVVDAQCLAEDMEKAEELIDR